MTRKGFLSIRRVSIHRVHNSAPPSLRRVPRARVPLTPRYYEVLRLPAAHFAALRCLRLAIPLQRSCFALPAAERCRGRVSWSWSPGTSGRDMSVETTGSPTFLGNPHCALALLSDPGRTDASGHCDASARPPLCPRRRLPHWYFRGSITRLRHWLSTLRRPGRPDATQDSLPVVGQTLPDGLDYTQGSIERFHRVSYMDPPFPSST